MEILIPKRFVYFISTCFFLLMFSASAVAQDTQPNASRGSGGGALEGFKNNRGVLNSEIGLDFCEGGSQNNCTDIVKSLMNPNDRVGIDYGDCEYGKDYAIRKTQAYKCAKGKTQKPEPELKGSDINNLSDK